MHNANFQNCAESVIAFIDATQSTLIVGICWLTHPLIVARVLLTWATPKSAKLNLYPPKLGPERSVMLAQLGLERASA